MVSIKLMLTGIMLALVANAFSLYPLLILGIVVFLAAIFLDLIRRDWTNSGKF